MSTGINTKSIGPLVPELPVADVERAQEHYRDALGFKIGWLYPGKEIGAVSRDNAVIFLRNGSGRLRLLFIGFSRQRLRRGTKNCSCQALIS